MSYLTLAQLLERTAIDLLALRRFEEEGLVEPELGDGGELLYSELQVERVRVAADLLDLGINEEGVEVILGMRERLISMQEAAVELLRALQEEEELPSTKRITVSVSGPFDASP